MTGWDLALPFLALLAAAAAGVRWLRVAQREHYLPGAASRFALRWWRLLPDNLSVAVVVLAGAVLALTPHALRWPGGLAALVGVALGPFGLGLRGRTSPLVWTGRLRRLAGVAVLPPLLAAVWAMPAGLPGVAVWSAVLVPVWIDLGLLVLGPLERRLGDRWVRQASEALATSRARVVAITGSYGKTTTKGYLAHLLQPVVNVVASPASFNNRMGLARAVNEHLPPDGGVFVAEMGTYGPGEIADLCSWVRPEVGVITSIGPVHLERMGSEEAIAEAKREILGGVGAAVLHVDHPLLRRIAEEEEDRTRVVRVATIDPGADVQVDAETGEVRVEGSVVGRVDVSRLHPANVACAVGAVLALGFDPSRVAGQLATLPTPAHRMEVVRNARGVSVVDDTYNANPAGATAALALLGSLGGRRVIVTPGMVELGRRQAAENQALARQAAGVASDLVVVGRTNRSALLEGAREAGLSSVIVVRSREEAVEWVRRSLEPGDAVLYENDLPDHYP